MIYIYIKKDSNSNLSIIEIENNKLALFYLNHNSINSISIIKTN
jgi:hypothetical protein